LRASFAKHRSTIQRTGAGILGFSPAIGSGSSWMIAVKVCGADARWNARLPVTIS
jgi:hypothetical protein